MSEKTLCGTPGCPAASLAERIELLSEHVNTRIEAFERRQVKHGEKLDQILDSITGGTDVNSKGLRGAVAEHDSRIESLEDDRKDRKSRANGAMLVSIGAFLTAIGAWLREAIVHRP